MNDEEICFLLVNNFNYMLTYFHFVSFVPQNYHDGFSAILIGTNIYEKLHNVTWMLSFVMLILKAEWSLDDDCWNLLFHSQKQKSLQRRYIMNNLSNTSIMKLMVHLFRLFGIMSSIKYKVNLQDRFIILILPIQWIQLEWKIPGDLMDFKLKDET